MKTKHIIIIGSGIGGLGAAALLAKEGYKVTVFEKNEGIGGRASVWKEGGFTFDMGPSWYLMPDIFERYFQLFGKKSSDFYTLHHLDPHYRVFFNANEYVDIKKNVEENLQLFERMEKGSAQKVKKYLDEARINYDAAIDNILYRNYTSILDFIKPEIAKAGSKLNVLEKLSNYTNRFTKNERIKQILQYSIVFLGGSPKNTPAFYSIMSHIDFTLGVYYPMGGVYKFIEALQKLCKEYDVNIKTNEPVEQLLITNKKVNGVRTSKKTYTADIVISNADYPYTEMHLLEKQYQTYPEKYWKKRVIAPSAFLMYLGVKGKIKNLAHHNLFFANNWEEHFDQIFKHPDWPDKPSYYVSCPSKTDSTVAPKNCENVFFLVPVPAGLEDSDKTREEYSNKVLSHLEELIGEKFTDRILVKRIFSHRDFSSLYNAYEGTALGLAHTLMQTALFRPRMHSKKVKNLFYVGQYTQPGIGMPMCLISAELALQEIQKNYE